MKRLRVHAPLVRLGTEPGDPAATAVCTLWCDPGAGVRPGDAERRLAPVAASLLESNLYEQGCTAAMAVRALGLRPARLALWQRLRPGRHDWLESRRLYAAGPIPDLGHSAELGLALALVRPGARFRGLVMATGSLSPGGGGADDPAGPGRRQGAPRDQEDTPVCPVGHLTDKLAELGRHYERLRARLRERVRRPPRALCFTPLTDEQGRPVAGLAVVADLRRLGVEVVPVGWLSEAVRRLGAARWPWLPADLLALGTVLGLTAGLVLGACAWVWRDWPIPLAFERGGGAARDAEPYLACPSADGRQVAPRPIPRRGAVPRLAPGQALAWTVRVGDPAAWDARLLRRLGGPGSGYHLLFAVLSADGLTVLADRPPAGGAEGASPPYRAVPGALWEQWFEVPAGGAGGERALIVLARRDRGFDPDALARALEERLRTATPADAVYRALGFLQGQAPGVLVYQFERANDVPDPCRSR